MNTENQPRFYHQDLDKRNKSDLRRWMTFDEVNGVVDEEKGGIVAYVHTANVDAITKALNDQATRVNEEVFDILQMAYSRFSKFGFNWEGRDTSEGQFLLARMRDLLATHNGVKPDEFYERINKNHGGIK